MVYFSIQANCSSNIKLNLSRSIHRDMLGSTDLNGVSFERSGGEGSRSCWASGSRLGFVEERPRQPIKVGPLACQS